MSCKKLPTLLLFTVFCSFPSIKGIHIIELQYFFKIEPFPNIGLVCLCIYVSVVAKPVDMCKTLKIDLQFSRRFVVNSVTDGS